MDVWVMTGSCDGELFASSHLTEKGAVLAAIRDLLEFLGVEDEETAQRVVYGRSPIDAGLPDEPIEWDSSKLKEMDRNKLHGVFGEWSELTWDNDVGYRLDILKTRIEA